MSDKKSNLPVTLGIAALIGTAAAGIGYAIVKAKEKQAQQEQLRQQHQRRRPSMQNEAEPPPQQHQRRRPSMQNEAEPPPQQHQRRRPSMQNEDQPPPQQEQPQHQPHQSKFNTTSRECAECCVCLGDMDVTIFPCGHSIHTKCANQIRETDAMKGKERSECPTCRMPFKWSHIRQGVRD